MTAKASLTAGTEEFGLRTYSSKTALRLIALLTFICLGTAVVVARDAVQSIQDKAKTAARERNDSLVASDEIRIRKTIAAIDTALLVIRQDFLKNPEQTQRDLELRLTALQLDAELNARITVTDAQGFFLATTASADIKSVKTTEVADREYFVRQRLSTRDELQVGANVVSRLTGAIVVPFTRKIVAPDGTFMGLVFMAVNPRALSALDVRNAIGTESVRELIDLQGHVIVRQNAGQVEYQGDASKSQVFKQVLKSPSGSYEDITPLDGVRRLVSYRLVAPYGLISIASTATSDILASAPVLPSVAAIALAALLSLLLLSLLVVAVTRHRAAMEQLASVSARKAFLMEQIPVMFLFVGRVQGRYLAMECNERLLQTLEYHRDEIIGAPMDTILQDRTVADCLEAWQTQDGHGVQGSAALTLPQTLVTRSGRTIFAMAELSATQQIRAQGADHQAGGAAAALESFCISFVDVSTSEELKLALFNKDMSFKRLVEVLPEHILAFDASGRLTWSNLNAQEYFGLEHAPQALSMADLDGYIHADDQGTAHAARRSLLLEPTSAQSFEVRLRRFDGAYRWFSVRIVNVFDAAGLPNELISASTDIEERRKTDERLLTTQRLEITGQLAGGLAHDFNNLLSIIIGNLDLAQHTLAGQAVQRQISVALGAAERGASLVKSLLTLASQQMLKPSSVELNALVNAMLPLLYQAIGPRVRLQVTLPEEDLVVVVDTARLESCILNLAVNARDAMPQGGTLELTLAAAQEGLSGKPGAVARLSLTDTGTGMSEEVKRRALEPFFTTKERGRGTGLGLAMVAGFVHQSGGVLKIRSMLGVGTTMDILLPLSTQAIEPTDTSAPSTRPTALQGTVLIVDDEAELASLIATWMRAAGFGVHTASNVEEAIAVLTQTTPDLVISDVVMPGRMSGFDLVRFIREDWPETQCLLMSGYSKEAILDAEDPQVHLLTKPFRQAELMAAVLGLMQTHGPDTAAAPLPR